MLMRKPAAGTPSKEAVRDTVLGADSQGEGTLQTKHDIYIAGDFRGSIKSEGTVVLNGGAKLEADVTGRIVIIHGHVIGNVTAVERLEVGATGRIKGDVRAGAARVTEGGQLEGSCIIVSSQQTAEPLKITNDAG